MSGFPRGASGSGKPLGYVSYGPDPQSTYNLQDISVVNAPVDATNLTVKFVAPASGNVLVQASCLCYVGTLSNSGQAQLVLFFAAHTTQVQVSQIQLVGGVFATIGAGGPITAELEARGFYSNVVTGLTPGASYQWDLWAGSTNGVFIAQIWASNGFLHDAGPAEIYVWAL